MKTSASTAVRLAATALATAALGGCANMGGSMPMAMYSQDTLPDAVKVPAGHKVAMETVGVGEITYECRAKATSPATSPAASPATTPATAAGEFEWAFVGPKATLNDRSGKAVGKYYGPPATWESMDGSRVTATQLAVAPAGQGNIPLQLVKANPAVSSTSGGGAMMGVSHIQRVATKGGAAPAMPCGAGMAGQKQVVSYRADYIFWKAV